MTHELMEKAYQVYTDYEDAALVVFANSAGKAKAFAARYCEIFCDYNFTELRVRRLKIADTFYRGGSMLDWDDPQDRRNLVSIGWHCDEEWWEPEDCAECSAEDICEWWQERKEALC